MNIFFLDKSPKLSAQYQCNKHVIKMIVESAQLLSTAHRVLDGDKLVLPDDREQILYKATHINHPCAVWCRATYMNYRWLADHLEYLLDEYTLRYKKQHKSEDVYHALIDSPDCIEPEGFTTPPCCMPDEFKISDNYVDNYREYYRVDKAHLHAWKNRDKPNWI